MKAFHDDLAVNQKQIAFAMGWKEGEYREGGGACWLSPCGQEQSSLPDPACDANDCERLIDWLVARDVDVTLIYTAPGEYWARIVAPESGSYSSVYYTGSTNDWKQTVCLFAMHLIELLEETEQ